MRIAILVQGRFHAFDLGRALRERGHEVVLHTNYPQSVVRKWDTGATVESFRSHLVLHRVTERIGPRPAEPTLHKLFGRWGARHLRDGQYDIAHCWSGVAEESVRALAGTSTASLLMRGSSHIQTQRRLLDEEADRTGVPVETPSDWKIDRELQEYELSDRVVVLSHFAKRTFVERGFPEGKLTVAAPGVRLDRFGVDAMAASDRRSRAKAAGKLRVLYVGLVTPRKGLWDLVTVARRLSTYVEFRCVGGIDKRAASLVESARKWIDFRGNRPEKELLEHYAWADIFLFPTIEDGAPAVLQQAGAAGLPILATTNSSAPDLIDEGRTGWIVPIRDPEAIASRLEWCNENRRELAEIVQNVVEFPSRRTWDRAAEDFETMCVQALRSRQEELPDR